MLGSLQAKALAALVCVLIGMGAGSFSVIRFWYGPKVEKLTGDLADARRAAVSERAAREAIAQQCAANDAAATRGADLNDAAQRAIERANRELDNATGDDADPLRAQFERLRQQGNPAPGAGGDPPAAPGGADQVPRRP